LEDCISEKHQIVYLAPDRIYIIRIFGIPDEPDIARCFQDYDRMVEDHFDHQPFSFIINVTEEAHSSLRVVRMIRWFLENQKHREFIRKIAAINDNRDKVESRNSYSGSLLPFFLTEAEAIDYLRA
jgi:hypothetical protein